MVDNATEITLITIAMANIVGEKAVIF